MAEKDPIDLIKAQLSRINELSGLHSDHEKFKQWQSEIRTILEKVFSPKSVHYQNFLALRFREISVKTFSSPEIEKINSARYKKDLENVKNILLSAIKELNLDRTLFKKIQTTPETVEFSVQGEYYISSGISDPEIIRAIESAFEGSGLNPLLGAKMANEGSSINYRMNQIRKAKFGIYDLSISDNEDILIEIGMAIGLGKEVILISKKGFPLPTMIEELNRIEYENPSDLNLKLKSVRLP